MRRLCAFVAALLLGAWLPLAAAQTAAQTPVRGGVLQSVLWPEPGGIVPGLHLQSPALLPGTKIFESLLTYDFNLQPQPSLAESWQISPDGLKYTFKLRRDVKWHDGKPFTADDVVFTFSEFIVEIHPRSRAVFQRTKVNKIDDHTVEFTLTEPFAPLIRSFDTIGGPVLPAHIYKGTDYRKNPANANPIGTGPFKFREWRRGEYIHLVRNDDYWRKGMPYLDAIYYRFIPDAASRALAIESQQFHIATQNDLELIDVARLSKLPYIDVTHRGWEWGSPIAWIQLNLRKEPFNDRRFRQALMHAIDREQFRDTVFHGFAKVATGPIHSSSPYYEPNVKRYEFSPAKAEALLDEMGLKRGPNGVRMQMKMLGLPYGEVWNRAAESTRQALRRIGIDVVLESTDAAGFVQRLGNWDYDVLMTFLTTLSDPALGVSRTFLTENQRKGIPFTNESGYSNPKVDALFKEAASTVDESRRKQLYSEVQKLLVEDAALIWLVELQWPTATNKRVHNAVINGLGPNSSFAEVWLAK
ncbi:MAG TPA: ABC transporter substrate-binding protein [Burkholderiaceae bacterium]|nr:ABC transporter substrate-binding protein [Burkholderiaceae bacterium]